MAVFFFSLGNECKSTKIKKIKKIQKTFKKMLTNNFLCDNVMVVFEKKQRLLGIWSDTYI